MLTQSQTDRELEKIKRWYEAHFPLCIFCGHLVRKGSDLAHLIRRSYSLELQTVKLNTGLAHRQCHEIFDDYPDQAIYLPRILECLYIMYLLDPGYFYHVSGHYEQLSDMLALFPLVERQDLEHHGQLLQLNYLFYMHNEKLSKS